MNVFNSHSHSHLVFLKPRPHPLAEFISHTRTFSQFLGVPASPDCSFGPIGMKVQLPTSSDLNQEKQKSGKGNAGDVLNRMYASGRKRLSFPVRSVESALKSWSCGPDVVASPINARQRPDSIFLFIALAFQRNKLKMTTAI